MEPHQSWQLWSRLDGLHQKVDEQGRHLSRLTTDVEKLSEAQRAQQTTLDQWVSYGKIALVLVAIALNFGREATIDMALKLLGK